MGQMTGRGVGSAEIVEGSVPEHPNQCSKSWVLGLLFAKKRKGFLLLWRRPVGASPLAVLCLAPPTDWDHPLRPETPVSTSVCPGGVDPVSWMLPAWQRIELSKGQEGYLPAGHLGQAPPGMKGSRFTIYTQGSRGRVQLYREE
jgi:hypothetical protein